MYIHILISLLEETFGTIFSSFLPLFIIIPLPHSARNFITFSFYYWERYCYFSQLPGQGYIHYIQFVTCTHWYSHWLSILTWWLEHLSKEKNRWAVNNTVLRRILKWMFLDEKVPFYKYLPNNNPRLTEPPQGKYVTCLWNIHNAPVFKHINAAVLWWIGSPTLTPEVLRVDEKLAAVWPAEAS